MIDVLTNVLNTSLKRVQRVFPSSGLEKYIGEGSIGIFKELHSSYSLKIRNDIGKCCHKTELLEFNEDDGILQGYLNPRDQMGMVTIRGSKVKWVKAMV